MTDALTDRDDLKQLWQQLERRLARQEARTAEAERRRRFAAVQARLRPLRWGQALQIPLGLAVIVLSTASWWSRWDMVSVRIAAMAMHVYGIALVTAGAQTLALLARVDYGAPVLEIQRRLAELRRWYGLTGLVLGMVWWLLWLPALLMLGGLVRIDLLARGPKVLLGYVAACMVGLAASLWAIWWAERSTSPAVRRWAERAASGESLLAASEALDEIRRFEADEP